MKNHPPIGSDDGVIFRDSGFDAAADSLLSRAQVAESPDGFLLVQVGSGRLHPSDYHHVREVLDGLIPGEGGGRVGSLLQPVEFVGLNVEGGGLDAEATLGEGGGRQCGALQEGVTDRLLEDLS